MPDISEEELRAYRVLQGTVATMLRHPKAGVLLEEAHKAVDEKAPTPRLDEQRRREEILAGPNKEIADLKAMIAAEKTEREKAGADAKIASLQAKQEEAFARLRKQRWTEEGITGIKKLMDEHAILDVDIAASAFEKLHPPAAPIQQGRVGGWNLFEAPQDDDADWKKLLETKGESEPLVDNLARKALIEHRQAALAG
jgi:hypothetical protein